MTRVFAVLAAALIVACGLVLGAARGDGPPVGATAVCKDGTYSFSATHSGTCSHHDGVAQWLDGAATTTAPASAPAPTTTVAPVATVTTSTVGTTTSSTPAAVATAIQKAKPTANVKTCGAGYTQAVIAGAQKCLRAGEFCTHAFDKLYRRYGFRCIRYYANVQRYRLTHA